MMMVVVFACCVFRCCFVFGLRGSGSWNGNESIDRFLKLRQFFSIFPTVVCPSKSGVAAGWGVPSLFELQASSHV